MFIGRKDELRSLNDLYRKPGFHMSIIYGRRRIGKSTLIAEFVRDKKNIFYTATKVGPHRNLDFLTRQVLALLEPALTGVQFHTPEDLFDFMTDRLTEEKLVFVIDEFPFWAETDESILSVLQKYIDTVWAEKNLLLILCGSSLSFMESKVLSEKSPLFGRRDSQIRLEAFNYLEAAEFVPHYTWEEKAICYGVTGGVARYLALFDPDVSLDDNIKHHFFSTKGYLYDEPRNLLTQEFSDITIVGNILEQVAAGENALNVIAGKVRESEPAVLYSLNRLMSVGLIGKRQCITEEKNRKKVQYYLKDTMFKFWYAFIPDAISVIELGAGGSYYDHYVRPHLHDFMGKVFEDMCNFYTLRSGVSGKFGSFLTQTGTWWGMETITDSEGRKRSQATDIDVVGISSIDKTMIVGECKFRREAIDRTIYNALIQRASAIKAGYRITHYLFFSLGGYTDWVKQNHDPQSLLITLADMYQ